MSADSSLKVVIVGAGFGGIGAAIELLRHGFRHVTVLERSAEPGGTWYHNSYVERTRVLDPAEFTFVPLPRRLPAAA